MLDLLSIGDARIDNFLRIEEAHVNCVKQKCEICISWGNKIPVEELHTLVAGNNCNNAVGASRLNLKVALYGNAGDDANGKRILDHLKEEGVSTRYFVLNKGVVTELSSVINYHAERTILVYHQNWDYHLPDPEPAKFVYFSSVSPTFHKTGLVGQIENYLERTNARLVYNPGTHQLKYGVKKFPRLLSLIYLLIVNKEEAKTILGCKVGENVPIKKLLKGLVDLGPKMVVITDGSEGSYGFDGLPAGRQAEQYWKLGVFPAKLVEMTGSGDGYATGTLCGLFHGKSLPEAMRWGAANGASVVEQIGPQAGLLTYTQMQEKLKTNAKIIAKEI